MEPVWVDSTIWNEYLETYDLQKKKKEGNLSLNCHYQIESHRINSCWWKNCESGTVIILNCLGHPNKMWNSVTITICPHLRGFLLLLLLSWLKCLQTSVVWHLHTALFQMDQTMLLNWKLKSISLIGRNMVLVGQSTPWCCDTTKLYCLFTRCTYTAALYIIY